MNAFISKYFIYPRNTGHVQTQKCYSNILLFCFKFTIPLIMLMLHTERQSMLFDNQIIAVHKAKHYVHICIFDNFNSPLVNEISIRMY